MHFSKMFRISIFLTLFFEFSVIFIIGKCQEMPLIFNIKTNAVINLEHLKDFDKPDFFAIACPVQEDFPPEKDFSDRFSIGKHILFVQNIHTQSDLKSDMNLKICETPFEPAVVLNKISMEVEFGYEIYYKESFKELNESPRKKYAPISDLPTSTPALAKQLSRNLSKSFTFPAETPKMNLGYEKMNFLWIPMLSLSFDGEHLNPNRLTYETEINFPDSSGSCENYELGIETYQGVAIDKAYERKNLDEVFENVVKPENKQNDKTDFIPELATTMDEVCITRWSLIPDKYFYFRSAKFLTCSYYTTVPVWCYLANELLRQLDEFIDIITEEIQPIGGKLHITSGTNGILKMTKKYLGDPKKTRKFQSSSKEIYLQKNSKIPMPASVYKIVEYESSTCQMSHDLCRYSIIIEIFNQPYITMKNKICEESNCGVWGWNSVMKTDGIQLNYVACCQLTSKIWKRLKLPDDRKKAKNEFDLNTFLIPYTNENNQSAEKTLKDVVDERIREIRQGGPQLLQFNARFL